MLGAMIPFIFTFYFGTLITGINPKTLQKIEIPAKTVVNFRIAKAAKNAILGAKKESGFRGRQRWESSL
jgi:hypothetical protein